MSGQQELGSILVDLVDHSRLRTWQQQLGQLRAIAIESVVFLMVENFLMVDAAIVLKVVTI